MVIELLIDELELEYELEIAPIIIVNIINAFLARIDKQDIICVYDNRYAFMLNGEEHPIKKFNKSTVRSMFREIRKKFSYERNLLDMKILKLAGYIGQVADFKILAIDEFTYTLATYHDGMPYITTWEGALNAKKGDIVPFYVAKITFDTNNIAIKVNRNSKKLPEMLFKRHIKGFTILECIKRVPGVFSTVVTDVKIDIKLVKEISAQLNEAVYVHLLSEDEVRNYWNGTLSKNIGRNNVKTHNRRRV
jgi:hypothetical protein